MSATVNVYLALGSNIRPEENIPLAVDALAQAFDHILAHSSAWQTAAVGSSGPDFINAVVLVESPLTSQLIKNQLLRPLEAQMGRVRQQDKNAPRTIDLDVLLYDDRLLDDSLWNSAHLAVPLAELYPGYLQPATGQSLGQIARDWRQTAPIRQRADVLNLQMPSEGL